MWSAIEEYLALAQVSPADACVMHAETPVGCDAWAREWSQTHGARDETWEAQWILYPTTGGCRRNSSMVAAGAEVCLAFPLLCDVPRCDRRMTPHWEHLTDDIILRAAHAHIPVYNLGLAV